MRQSRARWSDPATVTSAGLQPRASGGRPAAVALVLILVVALAGCGPLRPRAVEEDDPQVRRGPIALEAPFDEVAVLGERELGLGLPSCNGDPVVTIVEQDDDVVRLQVVTTMRTIGDACSDGVTIALDAPLGDRRVVDDVSGRPLRIARDDR